MAIKARNQQVVRQLRVIALLASGRRTKRQLANEFAVSVRTITRDLEALEEAHVPLADHGGVWRLVADKPRGLNVAEMAGAR